MSRPLPQIDFGRIGSATAASTEPGELGHLLVPEIEGLPRQTRLARRATPDAGIEFSCPAPNGRGSGRWAWQAKYLFRFDGQRVRADDEEPQRGGRVDARPHTVCVHPPEGPQCPTSWTRKQQHAERTDHVARWKATAAASGLTLTSTTSATPTCLRRSNSPTTRRGPVLLRRDAVHTGVLRSVGRP